MVADPLFTELLALSGVPLLIEAEKRAEEEAFQRQLRHLQMVYEMERRVDETAKSLADRFYPQLLTGSAPDLATVDAEIEGRLRMAFPEMDEDILQKIIADGRSRVHNYIRNAFVERGAEFYSQLGGIPEDLKPKLRSAYIQLRMAEQPPQQTIDLLGLQVAFGDEFDRLILPSVQERSRVAKLEQWLNDEKVRATYSEAVANAFGSFRQVGETLMPQLGMWVMSLSEQERKNLFGDNPYDPQRRSRRRSAILNRPDLSQTLPPLRVAFQTFKETLRSEIVSRFQLQGQTPDPAVVEAELQRRLQEMGLTDEVDYLDYLLLNAYRQQKAYEQTIRQMQQQQTPTGMAMGAPRIPSVGVPRISLGGGGGFGGGNVNTTPNFGLDERGTVNALGQLVSNTFQPVRQNDLFRRQFTTINALGFTRMSPPFGQQIQGIDFTKSPNDLMQEAFVNTAIKVEQTLQRWQRGEFQGNPIGLLNSLVPNFEDMLRFFTVAYNQAIVQGHSKGLGSLGQIGKWAIEVALGLLKDVFLDVIADNIVNRYSALASLSIGNRLSFKQSYKIKAMRFFLQNLQMRGIIPQGVAIGSLASAHPNEATNQIMLGLANLRAEADKKKKQRGGGRPNQTGRSNQQNPNQRGR